MGFISLKVRRLSEEIIALSLPLYFRVFFTAVAVFLGSGIMDTYMEDGQIVPVPLILLAICVLAVLYREDWTFDNSAGTIRHRFGLLFSYKTTMYRYEDIEHLELSGFIKGRVRSESPADARRFEKGYVTLSLYTREGERRSIEMVNSRGHEKFRELALQVAEHSGLPLKEDIGHTGT